MLDLAAPSSLTMPSHTATRIAAAARRALDLEVRTYPKPGLVSPVDSGSHGDMDAALLLASAATLEPFFADLAEAGAADWDFARLRAIGLAAEDAMMRTTGGINTHRGAIFALGLLSIAAAAGHSETLGAMGAFVRERYGSALMTIPTASSSHGREVLARYGAGGARAEAAAGFPTLYAVGLPALRAARLATADEEAVRVQACFALIAATEDTNVLHRGGPEALAFCKGEARAFLDQGGITRAGWREAAEAVHRRFVERRLSPGGAADLLAATLLVDMLEPA